MLHRTIANALPAAADDRTTTLYLETTLQMQETLRLGENNDLINTPSLNNTTYTHSIYTPSQPTFNPPTFQPTFSIPSLDPFLAMLKMSSAEFEKVLHPIFQEDEATLIGKHYPLPSSPPYYYRYLLPYLSLLHHHFIATFYNITLSLI